MKLYVRDYRYASAVLESATFREAKDEIFETLSALPLSLLDPQRDGRSGGVKRRSRDKRYRFFPVDQKAMNRHLDTQFIDSRGWQRQPLIVDPSMGAGPKTNLKGDYKKGRLQVEVQFGNMARWYTDVFKFQLSYSLDVIDVAVLVVPVQGFANLIDENVANYERVVRELPWAKMSLTLPILVVGLEPDDYAPIQQRYEEAAQFLVGSKPDENVVIVPFATRLIEEPELPDDEASDG